MVAGARTGRRAGAAALGDALRAAGAGLSRPAASLGAAAVTEWEERRLFLWLPAAAGTGVLLYFAAGREPVLWLPVVLALMAGVAAVLLSAKPVPFCAACGCCAICLGFVAAEVRSRAVATPMLDRVRIVKLTGTIETVDQRQTGARFVLGVAEATGFDPAHAPRRVRLTTRRPDRLAAGDVVALTARLLPPARASLPGGYDFARDAYFAGIGAVGSVLGKIRPSDVPHPPGMLQGWQMWIDRARNALAARVNLCVGGGDAGAVAAAMVTGKRDLLSQDGRDTIREAGIFHIITIAGVQMTLVAGLLFAGIRRVLALSRTLTLRYPIKKWAAGAAMAGAIFYDIGTGSRIGTQRALFMTAIMLGAVLFDRRALTMRNLALAALAVIAFEPEAIMGASFQLSFAAVAALIAVQEARFRRAPRDEDPFAPKNAPARRFGRGPLRHFASFGHATAGLFIATIFATAATASFMAGEFHELSPYVFIGNPLTLTIIEFFAVPGALLGAFLYPLGLDAWVWQWVGLGIRIVLWAAGYLAGAPASTLHLKAFAPWALPCLTLALLHVVIWRTWAWRLMALPWLALGLAGAAAGPRYDLIVAPTGESVAVRDATGAFGVLGRVNGFTSEQWLRADGDSRTAVGAGTPNLTPVRGHCDALACVAPVPGGQFMSVVSDPKAFEEDCRRVDIVVTPLAAPSSCAAELIIDRFSLAETGAVGLMRRNGGWIGVPARSLGEDRPWSPAPKTRRPPPAPVVDDLADGGADQSRLR